MLKIKKWFKFYSLVILLVVSFSCSRDNGGQVDLLDSEEQTEPVITETTEEVEEDEVIVGVDLEVTASSGHQYTGNLKHVIGDVKQALIQDKFNTTSKIDNALDGFIEMGVNGVRIPIYPENFNPNQEMFDYFYEQAKARGFMILANPAQGNGGARIANGSLSGNQIAPKNIDNSVTILVNVVKAFSEKYECTWINPFNEDSRPGRLWHAGQMNNIYATLYNDVNGATLVGPGAWGIEASTEVLNNTEISNYITIATTHNLGFDHNDWGAFIRTADALPVWDSEATDSKVNEKDTRVDAALAVGVDGIVLYNSWSAINLTNGNLSSKGNTLKDKVKQYYYIQNKSSNKKIKQLDASIENSLIVQAPSDDVDESSQWEIVPTDNNYFLLKNRASKMYFRPENKEDFADISTISIASATNLDTQWVIQVIDDEYSFFVNRFTGKKINSITNEDISTSDDLNSIKVNQAPENSFDDSVQWKLIKAN